MTAAYNGDVDVTVEIAFGDTVFETSQTWVDVTSLVREFSVDRGRSTVRDDMNAGVCQVTLSNASGDFSPWNTQSTYAGDLKVNTQIRITATHDENSYALFHGYVEGWPNTWPAQGKDAVVVLTAYDGFVLLAMIEDELTESTEFSGTRVGNLLDTAGWPSAWRSLDAGRHQVRALSGEFNTILGELRRVVLVEDGLFFIDGGGNAVFKDGVTRIEDDTIQAVFSDDGSDLGYQSLRTLDDDSQLWNKATVTRVGGTPQTSTDTTSVDAYGQRDLHLSETLHVADGEAMAYADWLTSEYSEVRTRVPELVVIPESDPDDLWPVCLSLELWDKVNVERSDVTGDPLDVDCYVEGVSQTVTMVGKRTWTTTFRLSPDLANTDFWILGTSELGVDTRLAY